MNWVFQYNPSRWDQLRANNESTDRWSMKQNRQMAAIGDRIFFWRSGPDAALTAVGHINSPVYERESQFGDFAVDVLFEADLYPLVDRQEVLAVPDLQGAAIFHGWQGTNFRLTDTQANALEELTRPRLQPINRTRSPLSKQLDLRDLSDAISRNNQHVKAELRALVRSMDPRAFEFLVRKVLLALSYRNVSVTPYSGDKGIDLRAVFDVGGGASVDVAIQVKRTSSVDRPTVQNVRGSLTSRELGLIVTTGAFTAGALAEAQETGKVPIGLIDGSSLLNLMIESSIGVTELILPTLRLDPDSLSVDELTVSVEADNG